MAEHSRRKFLKHASAGGAVAGVAALTPTLLAESISARPPEAADDHVGRVHDEPFMAYVKDARTGEIAVLVGEREAVHQDRELAERLGRAAERAHNG